MTRFLLLLALAVTVTACDTTDPNEVDLTVQVASDIAADPGVRDPTTGQVADTDRFTLYSLRENRIIVNYDDDARADSASTAWDIGFRGSEIIVNGGTSGPGAGVAVVVEAPFAGVVDARNAAYTYRRDGESACPDVQTPAGPVPGPRRAVCGGSGNGWYTYVPFPGGRGGYLLPTPGRTLLVRLADNSGYAKVNFLSYYQGAPEASAITDRSQDRYYSFEYIVTDSSGSFVEEV